MRTLKLNSTTKKQLTNNFPWSSTQRKWWSQTEQTFSIVLWKDCNRKLNI